MRQGSMENRKVAWREFVYSPLPLYGRSGAVIQGKFKDVSSDTGPRASFVSEKISRVMVRVASFKGCGKNFVGPEFCHDLCNEISGSVQHGDKAEVGQFQQSNS